jgi:hypothetical protein
MDRTTQQELVTDERITNMDEQQLTATALTYRPIDPCPICDADVDELHHQRDTTWTAHPCGHPAEVTVLPSRVMLARRTA